MDKIYKVYTHTTPDGMVYVGVTSQKVYNRWSKSHYKNTTLQPYIDKFGWDIITHQVIYTTPDKEEAYKVEEEMRQYYTEKGCCINKQRSGLVWSQDKDAYNRQYYQDHREEMIPYNRQYRQDHKKEIAEYKHQWYQEHKEDTEFMNNRKDYNSQYYQNHKEERAEYKRKYRQDYKENIADYNRKYYQDHKEERAEYQRQYRANKKKLGKAS